MALLSLFTLFALWVFFRRSSRPTRPSLSNRVLLAITITVAAVCLFRLLDQRLLKGDKT